MFSPKRISEHLGITLPEAKVVRRVLDLRLIRGERNEEFEQEAQAHELYHDAPSRKLYIIDRLSQKWEGGRYFGVEIIRSAEDTCYDFFGLSYLNSGDSYGATLLYDHGRRKWILSDWGSIVERQLRRFE